MDEIFSKIGITFVSLIILFILGKIYRYANMDELNKTYGFEEDDDD
jgi:hypothetical protein